MEQVYDDDDFDKLLEDLDEFGKDALIKHVLTELELMRAMLELMRTEIRQMNSGTTSPLVNPLQPWTVGPIAGGVTYTVNCADTGDMQVDTAKIDAQLDADVEGFARQLDEMIARSLERSEKSKEGLVAYMASTS